MRRADLLSLLAQRLLSRRTAGHPLRVGIDGVDAAGKSRLAGELEAALAGCGRRVIGASVDGFHNPRSVRHEKGRDSPEGYFEDSFDYPSVRRLLLGPLGPGGDLRFRRAIFDHVTDAPVEAALETADRDAILLFDGIFLQRPELYGCFELVIFLEVPFEVAAARGARRGGGSPDPEAPTNRRYVRGQEIYLRSCAPRARADIVLDNGDLAEPRIVIW